MAVYAVTIFTGAFLLFQVQPLIGKYILPWFGGGPGVWTTCILFFQVLLLGGYAYAHWSSHRLKPRAQVILHLAFLAAALLLLPITPAESWKPHGAGNPIPRILMLLAASIGLPYLVLSATGPLVQQWFSRARPAASPYRLYALSNAGSLLALVSYPVLFETHLTRRTQAAVWGWGLVVYVICCGCCALRLWQAGPAANPKPETRDPKEVRIPKSESTTHHATRTTSIRKSITPSPQHSNTPTLQHSLPRLDRLLWLLLPACASVLLLATTNKMCQDVAVIPFLWVLPLALYLLSFVVCFDHPRWYKRLPFALALAAALGGMCWALFLKLDEATVWTQLGVLSAGLFVCCLVCHGELYRLRPDPERLTSFYLMIATGGALGGIFVAVAAPLVFNDYYELHCGLVLCGLLFLVVCLKNLRPALPSAVPSSRLDARRSRPSPLAPRPSSLGSWRWAPVVALSVGLLALGAALLMQVRKFGGGVCRSRNFYGVLTVLKGTHTGTEYFKLAHGRTAHGLQLLDPQQARWPTLYFSERSGVGLAMSVLPAGPRRIGVVGLGTGTLAAYGRPGDYLRFYEINPEVERLARSWFTYLTNCLGKVEVVPGDARLSLEREPDQRFDLLVLDAFNSDAVPVHLLTEDAFAVYDRHLATNGIIAVHVSNASLNLEPVVANVARRYSYRLAVIDYAGKPDEWWVYPSEWILLTRNAQTFDSPVIRAAARPAETETPAVRAWTDDFASPFQILRWRQGPKA